MRHLTFSIDSIGMNDDYYFDTINLPMPKSSFVFRFSEEDLSYNNLNDLNSVINYSLESFGLKDYFNMGLDNAINANDSYVYYEGYLYRSNNNRQLKDMYDLFKIDTLDIHFMIIDGGASLEHHGYRFIVHSDEKIHEDNMHIHIKKGELSARYSLRDDKWMDKHVPQSFYNDWKKILKPFIDEKREWFEKQWNMAMNGYDTPVIDLEEKQSFF